MFKLKLFTILLAVYLHLSPNNHVGFFRLNSLYPVYAQTDSTNSSNIQRKIEELKKEIASKAAKLKTEINKKLQNKAISGAVDSVDLENNKISLNTTSGITNIETFDFTSFTNQKTSKKTLTIKELKKDDYLVALGDLNDKGILTAKKVIVTEKVDNSGLTILWGQVQSIQGNSIVIKTATEKLATIQVLATALIRSGQDSESLLTDIKPGQVIIATGKQPDSKGLSKTSPSPASSSASLAPNPSQKPLVLNARSVYLSSASRFIKRRK